MKKIAYIFSIVLLFAFFSCSEENLIHPYGPNDGSNPGEVKPLSYVKTGGGAIITFQAPDDEDLMYVVAKYTLDNGEEMESRASAYTNKLKVEGFGNTEMKRITFYAVDRMENTGKSVEYEIVPGEPAIQAAFKTTKMEETFGGVYISMLNENRGNLVIEVQTTDSLNNIYTAHTEYTATDTIKFAIRGFDTTPRKFYLTIRDPWKNRTEVLEQEIEPIYEEELDRSKFSPIYLPGDESVDEWGFHMYEMWSGKNKWGDWNWVHSVEPPRTQWPAWFTFDLGIVSRLSRIKYWQRLGDAFIYQHGNPKSFELWGCAASPDPSGSFDGWTLLMTCNSKKPSGYPIGLFSAEDKEYAIRGEDFEFPTGTPAVRYIRMKVLESWSGAEFICFQQMWFWGQNE